MAKDFDSWWNEKYFHTTPFYRIYKELHTAGANLDYVDYLVEHQKLIERVITDKDSMAEYYRDQLRKELPYDLRYHQINPSKKFQRSRAKWPKKWCFTINATKTLMRMLISVWWRAPETNLRHT